MRSSVFHSGSLGTTQLPTCVRHSFSFAVTEKDFLEAVNKVIKGYQKFSATPKYMVYN